jgi:hypothetical protein
MRLSGFKCRCDNYTAWIRRETHRLFLAFHGGLFALGCSQATYTAPPPSDAKDDITETPDATIPVTWPDSGSSPGPGGCGPEIKAVDGSVHWTGAWLCPLPEQPMPDPA